MIVFIPHAFSPGTKISPATAVAMWVVVAIGLAVVVFIVVREIEDHRRHEAFMAKFRDGNPGK